MSDGPTFDGRRSRPRWVTVAAIVALVVVLLVVAMLVFGGGEHGPGRHTGDPGGHQPPPGIDHDP